MSAIVMWAPCDKLCLSRPNGSSRVGRCRRYGSLEYSRVRRWDTLLEERNGCGENVEFTRVSRMDRLGFCSCSSHWNILPSSAPEKRCLRSRDTANCTTAALCAFNLVPVHVRRWRQRIAPSSHPQNMNRSQDESARHIADRPNVPCPRGTRAISVPDSVSSTTNTELLRATNNTPPVESATRAFTRVSGSLDRAYWWSTCPFARFHCMTLGSEPCAAATHK